MVLPGRPGGRVGRCRNIVRIGAALRAAPIHICVRWCMPKALQPRRGRTAGAPRAAAQKLPRDVAEEIYRTARPIDQERAIGRLARAIELLERGDAGAAIAEAEKAKQAAPRSAGVREVLGMAMYGQGRWRDSLSELKAYRRISGRSDQNHIMADCLRALGRPAEVVPLAEEELRAKVSNEAKAEAVVVAASALADQSRYSEALAFLGRARTRDDVSEPYTLRLWYVKGDILARAGRTSEAAAEFGRIVRHDAGAFDAAERLAELS
jgi:tetratricopeptide (TPR) repeat protein